MFSTCTLPVPNSHLANIDLPVFFFKCWLSGKTPWQPAPMVSSHLANNFPLSQQKLKFIVFFNFYSFNLWTNFDISLRKFHDLGAMWPYGYSLSSDCYLPGIHLTEGTSSYVYTFDIDRKSPKFKKYVKMINIECLFNTGLYMKSSKCSVLQNLCVQKLIDFV